MASAANNRQVQVTGGERDERVTPRISVFRRAVFGAVLLSLIGTPSFLLIVAFFSISELRGIITQIAVLWFPLWAVFGVWVAFKASTLYGLVGSRPDPLGPEALKLSALGAANIVVMFLFLILTRPR
jgi:hypothetical protein